MFTRNIEELLYLSKKIRLVENLKKNYKENIHYIIKKPNYEKNNGIKKKWRTK